MTEPPLAPLNAPVDSDGVDCYSRFCEKNCFCCPVTLRNEFSWDNTNFDRKTSLGRIDWVDAFGHNSNRCFKTYEHYLGFRIVNALVMTGVWIASVGDSEASGEGGEYFPIYLTNWTLTCQAWMNRNYIMLLMNLIISTLFFLLNSLYLSKVIYLNLAVYVTYDLHSLAEKGIRGRDTAIPAHVRTLWFLQGDHHQYRYMTENATEHITDSISIPPGVLVPGTFLVFVMYWALVFDGSVGNTTVWTHGVNFFVQLADLLVGSQPYLLLHGCYFFAYCLLYLTWTLIHYAIGVGDGKGNKYVYATLDWAKPSSSGTLVFMIMFIAVPAVNCIFWSIIACCRGNPAMSTAEDTEAGVELEEIEGEGIPHIP